MSTVRSSKMDNGNTGDTRFIGSKNLTEGVLVRGKFTKRFEREATGPSGKFQSVTYFFETEDGENVGLNKLGNLGYLMDRKLEVKEGETVEIEYNGKDDNNFHSFDVTVTE